VSQPDLTYSFWSPEETPLAEQMLGGISSVVTTVDYQALLEELNQAQALDHERVARIYHLEQALDQALVCLEELKLQVQDQTFLEAQLATTEEFAFVQQQAIARLKLQLSQQRQALELQATEVQSRDQAMQALLTTAETVTQAQQGELERLRSRISQDQLKVQTHRRQLEKQLQDLQQILESRQQRILELEAESLVSRSFAASLEVQLDAAQQQICHLCISLTQYQTSFATLEAQQPQRPPQLPDTSLLPVAIRESSPTARSQQDLAIAQVKVEELETQLDKQVKLQARWQQSCQELEAERDHYQIRIESLEQEVTEMQEQILRQARQASEYETAVQHWKDRSYASQEQLSEIKKLLKDALLQSLSHSEPNSESALAATDTLTKLLVAAQHLLPPDQPASHPIPALPSAQFNPLTIPDFLIHRQSRTR
jgi:chromosome segregation ATPase